MKIIKARAHSNIALVKYWGKRDSKFNLPAVASISITLEGLFTDTSLCFDAGLDEDYLILNGQEADSKDTKRLSAFIDHIRKRTNLQERVRVESRNNFPTSAGLASSASSFACLALAASRAANLKLSAQELSELARLGSGSAARSVFGGFVEMSTGKNDDGSDAVARQLYDPDHWDLTVLIAITSEEQKKTGSTDGMELSRQTSPYYGSWIESSGKDIMEMRSAIRNRNFEKTAQISEFSCLKMHALAMASNPGLIYWNGTTIDLIHFVREMRALGTPAFFTIDAGPQVKVICPSQYSGIITEKIQSVKGVLRVMETKIGKGAHILEEVDC